MAYSKALVLLVFLFAIALVLSFQVSASKPTEEGVDENRLEPETFKKENFKYEFGHIVKGHGKFGKGKHGKFDHFHPLKEENDLVEEKAVKAEMQANGFYEHDGLLDDRNTGVLGNGHGN